MVDTTEERDWPTPGETAGSSFWDPAGPFRPLRRLGWYLAGALLLVGVLTGIASYVLVSFGFFWLAWGSFSLLGTVLTGEAILWFVDTILVYLKQ